MGRNSVWDIVQFGIGLLLVQVNNDIWTKNLIQRYRFLMGACPTHVREKWINWFSTNRRSWRIRGRTASGTSTATALLEAMSEEAKIFTVFLAGVWGGISALILASKTSTGGAVSSWTASNPILGKSLSLYYLERKVSDVRWDFFICHIIVTNTSTIL